MPSIRPNPCRCGRAAGAVRGGGDRRDGGPPGAAARGRGPGEAGPHEARFAQLLEDAVGQWTFEPALVCGTPDGRPSEDACAEPDVVETPVALRLSYVFGFSQRDGEPVVELRGGRQGAAEGR